MNCFQEGLAKLQAAEPAEAWSLLCRTVELAPQFPEARICLGLAYALTHNIYPAIDHLEMAGKLDPEKLRRPLYPGPTPIQVADSAERL